MITTIPRRSGKRCASSRLIFGASTTNASSARGACTGLAPTSTIPVRPSSLPTDFPRGAGKFWEMDYGTESEQPDAEYPFNLSTGRVLYHWHGSTMTGRSRLEEIFPEAICEMHPDDAADLDVETGDWVEVSSRRGTITLRVLVTGRSPRKHGLHPLPLCRSGGQPADPGPALTSGPRFRITRIRPCASRKPARRRLG